MSRMTLRDQLMAEKGWKDIWMTEALRAKSKVLELRAFATKLAEALLRIRDKAETLEEAQKIARETLVKDAGQ